ncbi:MAG TPA: 1,4-alpha-glucan branching protein GlgB [Casimicrobiaceae bacterium]|nr:1,4-alpha-glucan branching protein GlgB [Casimicrobiaceae bacterium]
MDRSATSSVAQIDTRSLLTDYDVYLFKQGRHHTLYDKLGAHIGPGSKTARFAVWAPNAARVSVIGDFNGWRADAHPLMSRHDASGIWEGNVAGAAHGQRYKFRIETPQGQRIDKSDPFAFFCEAPPRTASCLWSLDYDWEDAPWMASRSTANALDAPMSIYEVHLGSWRRDPANPGQVLGYRDLAHALARYVREMGFTHVELMPVTEHPFYGSWGYQTTGYFAPTARYGTPQDFMYFVDYLHGCGIGVILDWVPSHFPNDPHGLASFDGTHLYEHADPRQGFHPEWNSCIFNYGRNEVRAFLVSSALFWLDRYHIDGLRVDGVASMLYLDYARRAGEWIPNIHGGRENLDAVGFLRELNEAVYVAHPDVQTIAEESTAWPQVSRPTYVGGLGFGLKWNMGWMHDTLKYFARDPVFRQFHQQEITFSAWYAFSENFVLPLSHDEVVHGKGSLLGRMPGDDWQKFANLRCLLGYMWGHPGKKLLFMGGEFGQWREWNHDTSLDWHLCDYPLHAGVQRWLRDLNRHYVGAPSLYSRDFDAEGFEWIDCSDAANSVVAFLRKSADGAPTTLVACNFTPVPRTGYRLGVPRAGRWREVLNSDAEAYGGSGMGNYGFVDAGPEAAHGRPFSLALTVPPLAALLLQPEA